MGLLQGSDATTSRFELQPPGSLIHRQHVTAAAAAQHRREEAGGQALPASRDRPRRLLAGQEGRKYPDKQKNALVMPAHST